MSMLSILQIKINTYYSVQSIQCRISHLLHLVSPRNNSLCNHVKIVQFLSLRSIGQREISFSSQKLSVFSLWLVQ